MPDDGGRLRKPADLIAERLADGGLGETMTGETHRDLTGQATYWVNADQAGIDWTAVACPPCHHVTLLPSIPRKPVLYWSCPQGHRYRLEPPIAVLAAGLRPVAGQPAGPVH
jgi:hypothetical protein